MRRKTAYLKYFTVSTTRDVRLRRMVRKLQSTLVVLLSFFILFGPKRVESSSCQVELVQKLGSRNRVSKIFNNQRSLYANVSSMSAVSNDPIRKPTGAPFRSKIRLISIYVDRFQLIRCLLLLVSNHQVIHLFETIFSHISSMF